MKYLEYKFSETHELTKKVIILHISPKNEPSSVHATKFN